ncbi:MAG: hypothetical protein J6K74_02380 [Marinifilaceae bacterium]|nr:hypothetical protein [Marinifilaceae bacterium]
MTSCSQFTESKKSVAKVYENNLYLDEVEAFIPNGTSPEDSILMAQSYIRNWITKQLLLHMANTNLSDTMKYEIDKQVREYKTSLLIHKYKQEYINDNLNVEISEDEIKEYYEVNKENFLLATPVVKALFIIMPQSTNNEKSIKEIKELIRSSKEDDRIKLEEMSITVANKYDNFNGTWIEVKHILNLIPGDVRELESAITTKKYIEKSDAENHYFLRIDEIKMEQTIAPLEYVYDEIQMILENQHKVNFEYELEDQINMEARRKNNVILY